MRLGGDFLIGIGLVFGERAFHYVIRLVGQSFAISAADRALKVIPDTVHGVGRETEFGSVELALLEELIEKSAAIALRIAVAGHETGDLARIFDGDLNEFALTQKAVHSRVVCGGSRVLRGILPGQHPTTGEE